MVPRGVAPDYSHLLQRLFTAQRKGMKLGLGRVTATLDAAARPDKATRVNVLIGGTNGKGSTAAMVAAIARAGGVRVGVFTSPHLHRFTERFSVAGRESTPRQVVHAARVLRGRSLTFFESATVIAAQLFADTGCELGVYEVGLGGRLDSTNALDASVACVTGVGLEHTEWLGESIAEIAFEKAAIFRGRPLRVVGTSGDPTGRSLLERAASRGVGVRLPVPSLPGAWPLALAGDHQRANAACARAVASGLAAWFPQLRCHSVQKRALARVAVPARGELVHSAPRIIIDGAHNPQALKLTMQTHTAAHTIVICGWGRDKDADKMGALVRDAADVVIATAAPHPRALPPAAVAAACGPAAIATDDVAAALAAARGYARTSTTIVVTGSLFLCAAVRALILDESADTQPVTDVLHPQAKLATHRASP